MKREQLGKLLRQLQDCGSWSVHDGWREWTLAELTQALMVSDHAVSHIENEALRQIVGFKQLGEHAWEIYEPNKGKIPR